MSEYATHQKIALITGANRGIGRAAAEQLAALGMTVLIGARDPRRGEDAAAALRAVGDNAHAVVLDVTDQDDRPGGRTADRGTLRPPRRADQQRRHHRLRTGLRRGRPRSSPKLRRPGHGPSRDALNALTVQYANELRKNGILINAADPGYVDTEINNHSGYVTVAQGAAVLVRLATLGGDGPTSGFVSEDGPVPW